MIIPTKKQMQDPVIAEWVLWRLERAREIGDSGREEQLSALFDESTLKRLLTDDHGVVGSWLLRLLDPVRLAPVETFLLERWPTWTDTQSHWGAKMLARLSPERFLPVLVDRLQEKVQLNYNELLGIIEAMATMGSEVTELADELQDALDPDLSRRAELIEPILVMALRCGSDRAASILARGIKSRDSDEQRNAHAFSSAYRVLTGGLPYFNMLSDLAAGETEQRLEELAELFEPDAPLQELDRIARSEPDRRFEDAGRLLGSHPGDARAIRFVRELIDVVKPGEADQTARELITSFILGSIAAAHATDRIDLDGQELSVLLRLASADTASLPQRDRIREALAKTEPDEVIPGLIDTMEGARHHYGSANIAWLMGELVHAEFIEPLVDALRGDNGDVLCEAASQALAKHGASAEAYLLSRWNKLDGSQRIYGSSVLLWTGGRRTVEHLSSCLPEMKASIDDLDNWCRMAEAVPDRRLVELLKPELRRKHPSVDQTFVTLCVLTGVYPEEFDEVRTRAVKHREQTAQQARALLSSGGSRPARDTMCLPLVCPDCGDENTFDVRRVYTSRQQPGAPPYIGDDLTCPSCGWDGPFEPTARIHLPLMVEMLRSAAAGQGSGEEGPLKQMEVHVIGAGSMAPVSAVEHYQEKCHREPGNVAHRLSLGHLYGRLGPERRAVECYEKCLQSEPECAEAASALATVEKHNGRPDEAWQILHRTWQVRERWRLYRLHGAPPRDFELAYVKQYNDLASEMGHPEIQSSSPAKAPVGRVAPQASAASPKRKDKKHKKRKVGRNARCPCGSGKKYKRCCLPKDLGRR